WLMAQKYSGQWPLYAIPVFELLVDKFNCRRRGEGSAIYTVKATVSTVVHLGDGNGAVSINRLNNSNVSSVADVWLRILVPLNDGTSCRRAVHGKASCHCTAIPGISITPEATNWLT